MMPVTCTSPGSLWILARGEVPDALLSLTTLIGRSDWIGAEYSASDLAALVDAFLVAVCPVVVVSACSTREAK